MVKEKFMKEIFIKSDAKLDPSILEAQFHIDGYSKSYRRDRIGNGGGAMFYFKEGISSKLLKPLSIDKDRSFFLVKINLTKKKWLLISNYYSDKKFVKECLTCLVKEIDSQSSNYDNILLIGDFNSEATEETMENLLLSTKPQKSYKRTSLLQKSWNSSIIDLFLSNEPSSFQSSTHYETGLFDLLK